MYIVKLHLNPRIEWFATGEGQGYTEHRVNPDGRSPGDWPGDYIFLFVRQEPNDYIVVLDEEEIEVHRFNARYVSEIKWWRDE